MSIGEQYDSTLVEKERMEDDSERINLCPERDGMDGTSNFVYEQAKSGAYECVGLPGMEDRMRRGSVRVVRVSEDTPADTKCHCHIFPKLITTARESSSARQR